MQNTLDPVPDPTTPKTSPVRSTLPAGEMPRRLNLPRLSGGAPNLGSNPRLRAVLVPRPGDANIAYPHGGRVSGGLTPSHTGPGGGGYAAGSAT